MDIVSPLDSIKPPSRELTELQRRVVDIISQDSSLKADQVAEQAGCTESAVYKILQKQHVKEYVLGQVNARLLLSAIPAMECKSSLLSSKSDYIKDKASSDILDRNAIGVNTSINLGTQVNVKIDLS